MKCFKVFRRTTFGEEMRLTSSWAYGQASVEYEVGKLSKPPAWLAGDAYGITIFSSLKDAIAYRKLISGSNYSWKYPIFSVAVVGSVYEPKPMAANNKLSTGSIIVTPSSRWPKGTMMVDGIVPMYEIADDEVERELG